MDKKTRTLNALRGLPVDRPPMTFWTNFTGDQEMGQGCIDAHLALYRDTDEDFVKMTADGYMYLPDCESFRVMSDWAHLKLPKMTDFYVVDQLNRIKAVREGIHDETYVFYNMFNALTLMNFSTSDDFVMACIRDRNPDFLAAYDAITDWAAEFASRMITEAGCKGVFHCIMNGEKDRFTPEEYAEWVRPRDLRVIEATNQVSDANIIHLCGGSGRANDMSKWKDYPAAVMNWDIHVDSLSLADGKSFFPRAHTVMGGFSNKPDGLLCTGTREEIQKYTRDLVQQVGRDRFILAPDCSVPNTLDHQRMRWVAEALDSLI